MGPFVCSRGFVFRDYLFFIVLLGRPIPFTRPFDGRRMACCTLTLQSSIPHRLEFVRRRRTSMRTARRKHSYYRVNALMLEARNLHKHYSGIPAVDEVSFIARAGEVTGYLGANGSGKSTTMKMATGLIDPSSGEILFEGRPIKEDLMAYRQRMGYVPEEPHLYTHLSGLEYLVMVAQLRNMDRIRIRAHPRIAPALWNPR